MDTNQQPRPDEAKPITAEPTSEEIALYAYVIWEREGRPEGRDAEHWQQAEAQLRETRAQG